MNLEDALQTFIAESRELLEAMEAALLTLNEPGDHAEAVNAIFRAAHTIKGSAGLFGLDTVVTFTHVVESVLDEVRDGRLAIDDAMVALLLACGDHIGALVDAVEVDPNTQDEALLARGAPLTARLRAYLGGDHTPAVPETPVTRMPTDNGTGNDLWHISVRFGADVLRNGMDPLSFIRFLDTLGTITGIVTLTDRLPAAAE